MTKCYQNHYDQNILIKRIEFEFELDIFLDAKNAFLILERVVSIESWDSPQCSTNVIGAFQGYIGKSMKQKNIFCISPFSNN